MVYDRLASANRRHERDRVQWSDIFKRKFDMAVKGRGEALIEGLYFGAAYALPPFFEFAAVREEIAAAFPDIHQGVWAHPNSEVALPTTKANGVASNIHSGWFVDGGFETQGPWSSVIPDYSKNSTYDDYFQFIYEDIYLPGGYFPAYPLVGANNWVQEPRNPRWSVTNEKANPNTPMGPPSKYSAKYTFASNDDVSGWLIPFYGPAGYAFWLWPDNDATRHYAFMSHFMPVAVARCNPAKYSEGGYAESFFHTNPTVTGMNYEAFAYSDQACTLEVWISVWQEWPPPLSDEDFPVPEGSRTDVFQTDWFVPEAEFRDEFTLVPGEWNRLKWSLDWPARVYPGLPFPVQENGVEPYGWGYGFSGASVRFRVKDGTTGQAVYLDDVEAWLRYEPYEDPFITVGVARWIRDEAGAYVGADLWVKITDTVSLRNPGCGGYVPPPPPVTA